MADEREDQPASAPWAVPGQVTGPQPWPPPPHEWAPPPSAPPQRRSYLPLVLLVGLAVIGLGVFAVFQQMGDTVGVLDLQVGDCLRDPLEGQEQGEITRVETVACGEPHDNEVYALFDLPGHDSAAYPGDDPVDVDAEDGCIERFDEYVGSPYADSALFVSTISPREQTWAMGDREVICLAFDPDRQLTGSVAGTGQ